MTESIEKKDSLIFAFPFYIGFTHWHYKIKHMKDKMQFNKND